MIEEIYKPIDLSDLIEAEHIKTTKRLKESIEEYQKKIVAQIVAQNPDCKRAGTYERGLVTSLGEVLPKIAKIYFGGGNMTSPMLDLLSIRRKKYSQELRMLAADTASRLSYGKSRCQLIRSNSIDIPKTTIHSFVQEVGAKLGRAVSSSPPSPLQQRHTTEARKSPIVLEADGTKTHSTDHKENNVRVGMTYDQNTKEKHLFGVVVNKGGWSDVAASSRQMGIARAEQLVSSSSDHQVTAITSRLISAG